MHDSRVETCYRTSLTLCDCLPCGFDQLTWLTCCQSKPPPCWVTGCHYDLSALPQCPETKTSDPESSIAKRGSAAAISAMDKREAKLLFERCLPKFVEAGLQVMSDISDVKVKEIASLWAGMGPLAEPVGV